jgi:hypothetical protein
MRDCSRLVSAVGLDSAQRVMRRCGRQQVEATLEIGDRRVGLAELVLNESTLQVIIEKAIAPSPPCRTAL